MTCGYTTSTRPFTLNMLRDPGCRWVKALSQTLRSSDSDASIAARNARDIAKERDLRDLVGFCLKHIWICDILRLLRMFRCRNGFWSRRISILGQYGSVGVFICLHASPSTPLTSAKRFGPLQVKREAGLRFKISSRIQWNQLFIQYHSESI